MQNIVCNIVETIINDKLNYSILTILDEIYAKLGQDEQKKLNNILIHNNRIDHFRVNVKVEMADDMAEDSLQLIKSDSARKCLAKTPKGKQCSRGKFEGSEYCGIHMKEKEQNIQKPTRKAKSSGKKKIGDIDTSLYIKTATMNIEDTEYLVDECGIVYSNDRDNLIMGYIADDTVHWIS
jgi:hypothetical protein